MLSPFSSMSTAEVQEVWIKIVFLVHGIFKGCERQDFCAGFFIARSFKIIRTFISSSDRNRILLFLFQDLLLSQDVIVFRTDVGC